MTKGFIIDTSLIGGDEFKTFLDSIDTIHDKRRNRRDKPFSKIVKTREETFESSFVDDEDLLHLISSDPLEKERSLNFDFDSGNLFQYFEEDVLFNTSFEETKETSPSEISDQDMYQSEWRESVLRTPVLDDPHRPIIVNHSPKVKNVGQKPSFMYEPEYLSKTKVGNPVRKRFFIYDDWRKPDMKPVPAPRVLTKPVSPHLGCVSLDKNDNANLSVRDKILLFNKLSQTEMTESRPVDHQRKKQAPEDLPFKEMKTNLREFFNRKTTPTKDLFPDDVLKSLCESPVRARVALFEANSECDTTTYNIKRNDLNSKNICRNFNDSQSYVNRECTTPSKNNRSSQSKNQPLKNVVNRPITVHRVEIKVDTPSIFSCYAKKNHKNYFPNELVDDDVILSKLYSKLEAFILIGAKLRKLQDTAHKIGEYCEKNTDPKSIKLERFLCFLCDCAEIYSLIYSNHCDTILNVGRNSSKPDWDHTKPPENELQKTHDSTAALSEHQLRVQASLQRLNIPDWFRHYNSTPKPPTQETAYKPGAFTRKRASDSGRWAGLNSKTTSLSSLGSQRSDRSPLMLSPSAHSHTGGQIGFSRWSTSHLNSTQTSPSISTRGSFSRGGAANSSFMSGHSVGSASIRNSFRQPYLGWRSQEKLSQPRTPHERLASSLLAQQQQSPKPEPVVTPEIQSSIKEVTSAIVHYVNDQTNRTSRSRSTSPNSRRCWLESSFVGIRPLESPQTPVIDNSFNTTVTSSIHSGTTSDGGFRINGVEPLDRSSAGSASLEDVLASLLGLPTATYRSTGDSANETGMLRTTSGTSSSSLQVEQQNRFRRRSEGDAQRQHAEQQQQNKPQQPNQQNSQPKFNDPKTPLINPHNTSEQSLPSQVSRRVSLDSSESKTTSEIFVKCRNTKCDQSASPIDAKKYYKSCHNCSHLYCSRECRRAHWEKHRKACLHSRVSNLCRQVLSSCKDDIDTLRHLSLLARKGYLSQGRGVVRILFRSPENAEGFIKNGFQCMGEASYVRWPDLMPAEMGLELYSELLRLSTEYKPDSKMLIYVAICVVSEAPGTGTAPVKWERQLVSRCAKLKLCKAVLAELDQTHQHVVVKEPSMEILILIFNTQRRSTPQQREMILTNIQLVLSKRGVILRKHYPEIYQRLQTFVEGQTDRFLPVTMHPRDSTTGQGFVCIIMPNHGEGELIRLPTSDTGNRVSTIDVGEEVLES